jgi:hypothetical protein
MVIFKESESPGSYRNDKILPAQQPFAANGLEISETDVFK